MIRIVCVHVSLPQTACQIKPIKRKRFGVSPPIPFRTLLSGIRSNPAEQVSWDDVQAFVRRLNQREGHSRRRLPAFILFAY
jgi:formylglycine-generating enzyme required for sulfatase activity